MKPYTNVAESYALYDTIIVSKDLFGKERSINGWYTSFADFSLNERHTFFKSRTIGNSHLAYCNMDSADNVDFIYKVFSIGVRFFAPCVPDMNNQIVVSPESPNEANIPWWLFELPKHCGFDFRVQQDTILECTCAAMSPGYGPRIGGGAHPAFDTYPGVVNVEWQVCTGTMGTPCIDNRFSFETPIEIPRNSTIEANVYPSPYAREFMSDLFGPYMVVLPLESGSASPGATAWQVYNNRYGIQVSLYGYREVQQRGQYYAPGSIPGEIQEG